ALGGLMGWAADRTASQVRRLNTRKGPAVRASRVQVDRDRYPRVVQQALAGQKGLTIITGEAVNLRAGGKRAWQVVLADGSLISARAVVLTTGTFLGGLIHVGGISFPSGRLGDPPSLGLSATLAKLGLSLGRLKTGTPPRLLARSLDFSRLIVQPGEARPRFFSILSDRPCLDQLPCHLTRTNKKTEEIIRQALDRSPLYTGRIKGVGARYCPSIEDKIVKFPDKSSHQVFIEPEGLNSDEVYPNGLATSLPLDVQEALIRSLPGLEEAVLSRPGYAIEYDYANPRQLGPELMAREAPGLFLAGQINGTSGYEEAAAQGLVAGLNALHWVRSQEPVVFTRDRSYIGVMIDDLTTLGAEEPYRMFTSRAEYRLLLREDNAAERLTPLGRELGLVKEAQWRRFNRRQEKQATARQALAGCRLKPSAPLAAALARLGSAAIDRPLSLAELLKRPELSWPALRDLEDEAFLGLPELDSEAVEAVEVEIKYAGYVKKQREQVSRFKELEKRLIPASLDYTGLPGLSREAVEKLSSVRPRSLGQAARIPGLTPAALMILSILLKAGPRPEAGP
ncbi:MAG: tRNA uridine-5-carboxymethylaminomethyl(34) synthesis enzyme MnmG, partial [Deltaproteobacteria bacterium]|nr:tRNA uridine-5-carboxymethylaminomethyl(34) synthesis enzyme MnmG [Deltaproteobacteria bacterium]